MIRHKFYRCNCCGSIICTVKGSGEKITCCGEPIELLVANSCEDASTTTHIPMITKVGSGNLGKVRIGALPHPMDEDHYIEWIYLATANGGQEKHLKPGDDSDACFALLDDEPVAALAYCNKHGLWIKEI